MAEQLLEQARDLFEGAIDFEGQRLADNLTTGLLTSIGAISFLIGLFTQNILYTTYIGLGGTLATALLVIPPWPPLFKRNPVVWLPARTAAGVGGGGSSDQKGGVGDNFNVSVDVASLKVN